MSQRARRERWQGRTQSRWLQGLYVLYTRIPAKWWLPKGSRFLRQNRVSRIIHSIHLAGSNRMDLGLSRRMPRDEGGIIFLAHLPWQQCTGCGTARTWPAPLVCPFLSPGITRLVKSPCGASPERAPRRSNAKKDSDLHWVV